MFLFIPGAISILVTVGTSSTLYYFKGANTNYSMGIAVYACFALMVFYFGYIAAIAIFRYKSIEKSKRFNVCFYIIFSFIVLGIQIVFPEVLISALLPVATLIIIYENFENANYRRLRMKLLDIIMKNGMEKDILKSCQERKYLFMLELWR